MSLVDRTNETIYLSTHSPQTWEAGDGWEAGGIAAQIVVDHDSDSSFDPSSWVHISWTDYDHDSDTIRMTYEESELLHDRLGLILGRRDTD